MYNLQDFIVTTNIIDDYTFDIYFLHKETKKIWHSRDSESHRGEPIFYNFLKIEQLIDDINYNEKDIGDYEIVFRNNINNDVYPLIVTFNTKSLNNYSMWLHEYPTIICKNCIEEFTSNDIIIDSKNYTFCKKCYDERSCYLCNTVEYYSNTILNCDVCNKIVCSDCYRENSDNTGYCKDCFLNVSNWANEIGSKLIKEVKLEIHTIPCITQTTKICVKCNQIFTYEPKDEDESFFRQFVSLKKGNLDLCSNCDELDDTRLKI